MSRWILALLFSFGTVTLLTGCPAEGDKKDDKATTPEKPETPETPETPKTPETPEAPATN